MKMPSELRGDVISRKAAIEAWADWQRRAGSHRPTFSEILSALPSVPEPPNDARKICSCEKWADECAGWCANDTSVPISSAPTGLPKQFLESLKATYPDEFHGEAQDFKEEVFEILETLSSAPTGLTRERLDSLIVETWGHDPQTVSETSDDQFVIHEVFGARILRDAILESSSAPTPERES